MNYIGRLIFKATGVMSNRGLIKNSHKIGEAIADVAKKSGGEIKTAQVEKIVSDTVGKKAASRINFLDRQAFKEKMLQLGLDECTAERALKDFAGITSPEKYVREANIFINKELANGVDGVNTVSHELQHALSFSSGKLSIGRSLGKLKWGRKYIDKVSNKGIRLNVQNKYMTLQESALNCEELVTPETIRKLLYSKGILKVGDAKANTFVLKNLRAMYRDEVRSYSVGFDSAARYLEGVSPKQLKYLLDYRKFVVDVYKNLVQGISQELKTIRANRIRKFFGLKLKTIPSVQSEPI